MKKICNLQFYVAALLDLHFLQCVLYSTSQALSLNTHIEGVVKKIVIHYFVAAAILNIQ